MAHSMPALSRSHQSPQHNHNTHHHDDGNSSHPQPHAHAQDVDAAADGSQSHSRSRAETASLDAYAEHQVGDDCVDTHHRHNDNDADHDDDDESVVGTADVSRHKDNGKLQETRKVCLIACVRVVWCGAVWCGVRAHASACMCACVHVVAFVSPMFHACVLCCFVRACVSADHSTHV